LDSLTSPRGARAIFSVDIRTATGPVRGRVAIDTGPMRLADLVPSAWEITDLLVSRAAVREARAGRAISCRAGCGACCRQMVPLSAPEALHLREQVAALERGRREELGKRFARIGAELESRGLRESFLGHDPAIGVPRPVALEYFLLGLPCPFLESESCSIHPERPIACREYNVTSPASYCPAPHEQPVRCVPMPVPLSTALAQLTAELTGTRSQFIPLTLALGWAEEHAELGARTWPGAELFERFLAQLAPREADALAAPGSSAQG
jgi:Fe-S-cluster containining protein